MVSERQPLLVVVARPNECHEVVEDVNFYLELDAVYQRLACNLNFELLRELEAYYSDIKVSI